MRIDAKPLSVVTGGAGVIAALILGSPQALADPPAPVPPPPPPAEVIAGDVAPPAQAVAGDAAPPAQAVAGDAGAPAEVPHLLSPENLPPGTSDDPVTPNDSRGVDYLRDIWHAVQTQEVSGKDALLLLTQRPLDPNATPPPGMATTPTPPQPLGMPPQPGAPAPLAAEPAPPAEPVPLPAGPPPPAPPPAPGPAPLMPFLP